MSNLILLCSISILAGVFAYVLIYKPVLWAINKIMAADYDDDCCPLTYTPGQRSIIIPVSKYPSDEERQRIIEYLEDVIAELDCMGDE